MMLFTLEKQWSFPDTSFSLEKGEKVKISTEVTQTFISHRDGLADMRILFGNSDTSGGGILSLDILDDVCETPIRSVKKTINTLNSENTVNFPFQRIENSRGKIFCLKISFEQGKGSKKATTFVHPNTDHENVLTLSLNGDVRPNESIAFRPSYRNATIFADISELFDRISQYKPWFLKMSFLTIIVIISVIASFLFLFLIGWEEKKK